MELRREGRGGGRPWGLQHVSTSKAKGRYRISVHPQVLGISWLIWRGSYRTFSSGTCGTKAGGKRRKVCGSAGMR